MIFGKTHYDEDHKLVRYTPLMAIRDFAAFLFRFLSPANIRHGLKSVVSGAREYAVFFAALAIIQTLFCSVGFWQQSRAASARSAAEEFADYDIMIYDLTTDEWTEIFNSGFIVGDKLPDDDAPEEEIAAFGRYTRGYKSYTYEKYTDAYGEERVQVKVLLGAPAPYDSIEEKADAFIERYGVRGEFSKVKYSERMTYNDFLRADRKHAFIAGIGVTLLSVAILLILFLIRTNHYKFTYGIYMSFGADFEKLVTTASWEMIWAAVFVYLPSAAAAFAVRYFISLSSGGDVRISAGWLIGDVFWVMGVILLAVIPSVRIIAARTPVSLIVAADNSNYVSSPRYSFRIFDKKFPLHYELFGFWRFRKYYVLLLISAVIFTSLFICGIFAGNMARTASQTGMPQYTLDAGGEDIDTLDVDSLLDTDGIEYVTWDNSVSATENKSHLVLTSRQCAGISSKVVAAQQDGMKADNNFKYVCLSDKMLEVAGEHDLWKIEGDIDSVFTEKNTVAVSRYVNNKDAMDFKVGDTVTLAKFSFWNTPVKVEKYDRKYHLNMQVKYAYFDFIELKIGAVIDTGDTDDEYTLAMSEELFTELCGHGPVIHSVSVYTEDGLGSEQTGKVFERCRELMSFYDRYEITDNSTAFGKLLGSYSAAEKVFFVCAVLVLTVSPLVWFFSQSTFCRKRSKETYMLSAFGAADTQIGRLYLFSGGVLTLLAVCATVLLGAMLNFAVYYFIDVFMTSLGFISGYRFGFSFSWIGLAVCIAVSAVSALLATYLPFRKYCRDRDHIARLSTGDN